MKTARQALFAFSLLLFFSSNSYAAESSVSVQNKVNTSTTNESTTTSKCNIRTEVNGKVVESEECNIDIKNDGASVSVSTDIGSDTNSISPLPTNKTNLTQTPKLDEEKQKVEKKIEEMGIFQQIEEFFKNIFSSIFG